MTNSAVSTFNPSTIVSQAHHAQAQVQVQAQVQAQAQRKKDIRPHVHPHPVQMQVQVQAPPKPGATFFYDANGRTICAKFVSEGKCRFGAKCWYDHPQPQHKDPNRRVCRDFVDGFCRHGARCWFRHPAFRLQRQVVVQPNARDKRALLLLFAKSFSPFRSRYMTAQQQQQQELQPQPSNIVDMLDGTIQTSDSGNDSKLDTVKLESKADDADRDKTSTISTSTSTSTSTSSTAVAQGTPTPDPTVQRLQRILAEMLLPRGVQKHFQACVAFCQAWSAVLKQSWPRHINVEPPCGLDLQNWRGVKKTDAAGNFIVELDLMVRVLSDLSS